MVGLPSVENREMILKTLLAMEKVDQDIDFKELAAMTEGYSGSDLKVLFWLNCIILSQKFIISTVMCLLNLLEIILASSSF